MKKDMSTLADAGMNATGFYNRKSGSLRGEAKANTDVEDENFDEELEVEDDDEFVEEEFEAENGDEFVEEEFEAEEDDGDAIEEAVEEVLAEAKAETAKGVEEIEPAKAQEKEGDTMATTNYAYEFFGQLPELAHKAVYENQLDGKLADFVLDVIKHYPEARAAATGYIQAYEEDHKIPPHGWRYKGISGDLVGKSFDSEEEAQKAAAQALSLKHEFTELFEKELRYKKEDGSLGDLIPKDSRHYKMIMDRVEKKQSSQPQANAADDR